MLQSLSKQTPQAESMLACEIPRREWNDQMDLLGYARRHGHRLPTSLLRDEGWSLENPSVQSLVDKIRNTGRTLRDHVGSELFRRPHGL